LRSEVRPKLAFESKPPITHHDVCSWTAFVAGFRWRDESNMLDSKLRGCPVFSVDVK
jgi:hypothetical protein